MPLVRGIRLRVDNLGMSLSDLFLARLSELNSLGLRPDTSDVVCPDSTPVLFFGELERADVVTVGINPSWQEFRTIAHQPLPRGCRRFAHLSDLTGEEKRDAELALATMRDYFRPESNAYWPWFNHVERVVNALGSSLKDGTAAHTDILSCFATDPTWGRLKPASVKAHLSRSGYKTFLRVIQSVPKLRLVILFGGTARRSLETRAHCVFTRVPTPFDHLPKFAMFQPVLSTAKWTVGERTVTALAVGPYRSAPASPMSREEVEMIPRLLM